MLEASNARSQRIPSSAPGNVTERTITMSSTAKSTGVMILEAVSMPARTPRRMMAASASRTSAVKPSCSPNAWPENPVSGGRIRDGSIGRPNGASSSARA